MLCVCILIDMNIFTQRCIVIIIYRDVNFYVETISFGPTEMMHALILLFISNLFIRFKL